MTYVIDFAPPMTGFEDTFNTVRLGGAWAKRLVGGERVYLVDKPKSAVFGTAIVESVVKGKLCDLAPLHAANNHNQKGLDPVGAPDRFIAGVMKRYGPQKVRDNSLCTVIYLRLLNEKDHSP